MLGACTPYMSKSNPVGQTPTTQVPKADFKAILKLKPAQVTKASPKSADAQKPLVPLVKPSGKSEPKLGAHAGTGSTLQVSRAASHANAKQLGQVRQESLGLTQNQNQTRSTALHHHEDKTRKRAIELIGSALKNDADGDDRPKNINLTQNQTPPMQPLQTPATKMETATNLKAEQALALIEKIEVFVKSQRPSMALTLNNSLGTKVEIERVGPKQIALKLLGQKGPVSVETVSRIKDELARRGLTVTSFRVE
jgi:hypothetical protein